MTAPGELLVLRQAAEFPLEWAVVARSAAGDRRLLVVPADTNPSAGADDLLVPPRAAGGPLSLRCGFAVWLPEELLGQGERTGTLEREDLARIERRLAAIAAGESGDDPLGLEAEGDPDYIDWIGATVAPAVAARRAAGAGWQDRPAAAVLPPPRPPAPGPALAVTRWAAAALLLLSLGLTWTVLSLRHRLDRLAQPSFDVPAVELLIDGPRRGAGLEPLRVRVPRAARQVLFTVVFGAGLPAGGSGRLELQTAAGRTVWTSPPFAIRPGDEVHLLVPRELLPERRYRVALAHRDAAGSEAVELRAVELVPGP